MTDAQRAALDEQGFVHLPGFLPPHLVGQLVTRVEELFRAEGSHAGAEFRPEPGSRRLANTVDKDPLFAEAVIEPRMLELVSHVLGPRFKLSSLNVRSANPRNGVSQPLHCDMGALPDDLGYWVCNVIWMLDDFTLDNGATRAVPGTHRSGQRPQEVLTDPAAPHPDEVLVTGKAGDAVVMNAHLWHGGTDNRTDFPRRAMHLFYCRRDKPQQQYQKGLLRPETIARLTPRQREVLAIDDPLNDQLALSDAPRSGFLK